MKTAVLLGAGASRAFGYPLTYELLPRILGAIDHRQLFRTANTARQNARDRAWFARRLRAFFPGLDALWSGGGDPAVPGIGVTDLLTQVDRALQLSESRAGMTPEDLVRFRHLVERAIYEALLHDTQRRQAGPQAQLERFMAWLTTLPSPAGVMTTNYDSAVDRRLHEAVGRRDKRRWDARIGAGIDFGFAWRSVETGDLHMRPARPQWRLLKLHGSVNWLRCSLCGQIYLNPHGAIGSQAFRQELNEWNTCICNDWARLRLHLVTPSFVRQTNDAHLLGIWQAALETLRTADRWVIVGFSLPAEDVAIRALLLRAWDGHARRAKPKVVAVQYVDPAKGKSP
ncbi:MAG: hypothetical protein ACKOET_10170, partial [Verrucomicrobiota bacterium]